MTITVSRLQPVKLPDAAVGILFFLLALAIYRTPLWESRSLYFRDFQIFYTPMKHFLAEAMRHGEWAFWNPQVIMGSPFLADPQSGVLYPPSVLLLLANTPKAIVLSLVFHVTVAQLGLYFLSRHYHLGQLAAATGAIVYGLGGWMISAGNMMTEVNSAAWVPWTVLACERLWNTPTPRNVGWAAMALAMQMLAGWPEMFLMIGVILISRRIALAGIFTSKWLPLTVLAGLVATLIFSPQLLATWEAYTHSTRVGGMTQDAMLEFSATAPQWRSLLMAPALSAQNWNILALFPDGHVPLTLSLYLGPLSLGLAALGLSTKKHIALSWMAVIAIGIFLAMGSANPLAVALLTFTNRFRSPEKYLFLVHIGTAMLAALGVARLQNWIRNPVQSAAICLAVIGTLSANLLIVNSDIDLTAEKGYYDLGNTPEARYLAASPGRAYARSVIAVQNDEVRPLYAGFRSTLIPNIGTMVGISYLNGVSFLTLREQQLALDSVEGLYPDITLARHLGFFGTRYVLTDDPEFSRSGSWAQQARQVSEKLWRLDQAAPLLGFPTRVVPLDNNQIYSAMDQANFANGDTVFVSPMTGISATNQDGTVRSLSERPGQVNAEVNTGTGGLLVLRQFTYPGWHVSVNGQEAPLVSVNRFFIGVKVPAGAHQVRFWFKPSNWTVGLALSGLGGLTLLVLMFVRPRKTAN